MKEIAILITCHNRKFKTLTCLDALYKSEIPEGFAFDIFLVDDGSIDGTEVEIAKKFPKVIIIKGDGNLYWNRGMHKAWQIAHGSRNYNFYLWLNDDTYIFKNCISDLLIMSKKYNNQSIIVGITSSSKNKNQITYGGWSSKNELIFPNEDNHECFYFNGNIVLIPNFVFHKVGMNDITFRHALGDFDYGLRANKLGIKSYVSNEVLGICDVHNKMPKWCDPEINLVERMKNFRMPNGQNPEEFFKFEKRHKHLFIAVFHYFTNHIRLFLPQLWKKI